ncbi:hypothetical protein CLHUN_28980 [Ruminiclostridium hungatei]|uniref:Uncharacterized protein n=1 Tax=Ruminiclostridium hungatei TaxID=48256 RepID=A0A1V4SH08_RUMHU|nr:DUF6514 family protein [Ruminiclostridium hungatei]OPX43150.1 hypothetical protein CLHUN_28980 [Ruminiclostridium hungatei]
MELICSKKLEINESVVYDCKEINLEYYLVSCESDNSCTYGIQISMTKDSGTSETAVIKDVLPTKSGMIDLIDLMYKNSVTPVSARDIIYDCIA